MNALKSLLNLAQIESNRQNAQKSTGPRTEEGKARSRRNAVQHGLAGAGIALPTEDEAAVGLRFEALADQFQPSTPFGVHCVRRLALATIRTERAARHEAATLALRVRHAAEDFDRARVVDARVALARLRDGDEQARFDLIESPEGIARLIEELRLLRRCLAFESPIWSRAHGARLDACFGITPDDLLPSRNVALTEAALGSGVFLTGRDRAAIAEANLTPVNWALRQLAAAIDHEIDALRADDAAIDRSIIAADRAGAADRALFDPGPAAQLARRYEAAAVREVTLALRLLREVEAAPDQFDSSLDFAREDRPDPQPPVINRADPAPSTNDLCAPEVEPEPESDSVPPEADSIVATPANPIGDIEYPSASLLHDKDLRPKLGLIRDDAEGDDFVTPIEPEVAPGEALIAGERS